MHTKTVILEKKKKKANLPMVENESENPIRGLLPLKEGASFSCICFLSDLWSSLLPI